MMTIAFGPPFTHMSGRGLQKNAGVMPVGILMIYFLCGDFGPNHSRSVVTVLLSIDVRSMKRLSYIQLHLQSASKSNDVYVVIRTKNI